MRWPGWWSMARQAGKPVVIERLDFKRKKAEGESRRYLARHWHFRHGVEVFHQPGKAGQLAVLAAFTRLFRADLTADIRLQRTREEAREARMDVLGPLGQLLPQPCPAVAVGWGGLAAAGGVCDSAQTGAKQGEFLVHQWLSLSHDSPPFLYFPTLPRL